MTAKQILDSFSETLMRDERILSARERALLASLLQHARSASQESPQTQEAVRAVIASAVGETVAQRAFSVLGASMVEKILTGEGTQLEPERLRSAEVMTDPIQPQPPSHTPGPPTVKAPPKPAPHEPQHPGHAPTAPHQPQHPGHAPTAPHQPQPPRGQPMKTPGVPAPQPQPPSQGVVTTVLSAAEVGVAERPEFLPAKCLVLDEFLAPQEVDQLMAFTLEHEADFGVSEVISPTAEGGVVNYDHRRSRVLMDLGPYQDLILDRIKSALPEIRQQLGMDAFAITGVEAQITASNDGDFFHFHSDNGSDPVASRKLTFVYFFHREPRAFEGGELRIHDARLEAGSYVSEGTYRSIVPRQNQIVFFPCELMHEITPVKCPSQAFADSRFTVNGWLRH